MQISAAGMGQMAEVMLQKVQVESDLQLKMASIAMQEQMAAQQQQIALSVINAALTGKGGGLDVVV